jgi:hypothetical protein
VAKLPPSGRGRSPARGARPKPYAELAEIDEEDKRAAARRIPGVLALVGLGLRKGADGAPAAVPKDELKAQIARRLDARKANGTAADA